MLVIEMQSFTLEPLRLVHTNGMLRANGFPAWLVCVVPESLASGDTISSREQVALFFAHLAWPT